MKGYLAAKLHISLLLFEPLRHASRLCGYIYSSLYPRSVRIPADSSSSPSLFALRWSWPQVCFRSCLLLSVSTPVSHLLITLRFKRPAETSTLSVCCHLCGGYETHSLWVTYLPSDLTLQFLFTCQWWAKAGSRLELSHQENGALSYKDLSKKKTLSCQGKSNLLLSLCAAMLTRVKLTWILI